MHERHYTNDVTLPWRESSILFIVFLEQIFITFPCYYPVFIIHKQASDGAISTDISHIETYLLKHNVQMHPPFLVNKIITTLNCNFSLFDTYSHTFIISKY